MARPKRSSTTVSAKNRIHDAFWKLLSEMPYDDISIKALAAEAGLNHNSIYYHFENIDALAKESFENIILKNAGTIFTQLDFTDPKVFQQFLQSQPNIAERYYKFKLFASSNSTYLQDILKEGIMSAWLGAAKVNPYDLSSYDQMELDFIFSAIIALIARKNDPSDLEKLIQDDLGQAVIKTMKRILNSNLTNKEPVNI